VTSPGRSLGLERFVLFVTGMGNIRDVIPFPRTPKSAEF
jgi:asparaginyl-tRNA synthetase